MIDSSSESCIGIFTHTFRLAQGSDAQRSIVPTGHFSMRDDVDANFMVEDDGEKFIMDDNFDYDPARTLDLVEMTTFELVATGDLKNDAYPGNVL